MENLNFIKSQIQESNPAYFDLCSDFLILYSRFEYALKSAGYLQPGERAMASLQDFAATISGSFDRYESEDLDEAVNYIINEPPRVLVQTDSVLSWNVSVIDNDLVFQLVEYVRRVRNSLMHGAKYYGDIHEGSRNWQLIFSSMIIIDNWIGIDETVKIAFKE